MSIIQGEPRRGRGRPRTPGAEARILEAALEEYGERGWSGFTMDAVARRAGVGKSTVYLRWQDKDTLLTDAVSQRGESLGDVDTGTLRGDLEAVAVNLFHHYLHPSGWASLRVIIDTAGSSKPLGRFTEAVADVQVEFIERIIGRAVARGEFGAEVSAIRIGHCVYGSVAMQTLRLRLDGRTIDEDEIRARSAALAQLVLHGVHQ